MKFALTVFAMTLSMTSIATAAPNKVMEYRPADLGEKVASAVLNVESDGNGFECDIGLFQTDAINIGLAPGFVNIENFDNFDRTATVDLRSTPAFRELRKLASKVTVTNRSERLQGEIHGYAAYGFRVRDSELDRLAYDADFNMKHPDGFQYVVETPENQRAIQLMNALCETARSAYNRKYPEMTIPSLAPIGPVAKPAVAVPRQSRDNRVNSWFSKFF